MLEVVKSVNGVVNGFIWGIPAMICIIGIGLYLSIGTGFIQIRRFIYAIKHTLGKVFDKKEAESGAMTPFQAVCTALAGTVGTGNIASQVLPARSPSEDRVRYSGCGFPPFWECAPSSRR